MTLLDDAAVRFDFSQYDDVDAIVDVNGGWGPAVPEFAQGVVEFTADGLRIVSGHNHQWAIEGVASPLTLGAAMTILSVAKTDAAFVLPNVHSALVAWDVVGDGLGNYGPELYLSWEAAVSAIHIPDSDHYEIRVNDLAPSYDVVVDGAWNVDDPDLDSRLDVGVFIAVQVVDTVAQECRMSLVAPGDRFDHTFPFAKPVPDFVGTPTVIDTIYYGTGTVVDGYTMVEFLGWNRVLTDPEIESLVAFFVDGTPLPEEGGGDGGESEGRNYRQRRRTWPLTAY